MSYNCVMEFIESPIFTKYISSYLKDDEYSFLQWHLALYPESGDLIPQSGGLRKVRWMTASRGKRRGIRIIYYYHPLKSQIWLLTIYAKNETENISTNILRKIREELEK